MRVQVCAHVRVNVGAFIYMHQRLANVYKYSREGESPSGVVKGLRSSHRLGVNEKILMQKGHLQYRRFGD